MAQVDPFEAAMAQHRAWAEHEKQVYARHGCWPGVVDPTDYEVGTLARVAPAVADERRRRRDLRLPPQGG
jgi:hypothetical protein